MVCVEDEDDNKIDYEEIVAGNITTIKNNKQQKTTYEHTYSLHFAMDINAFFNCFVIMRREGGGRTLISALINFSEI